MFESCNVVCRIAECVAQLKIRGIPLCGTSCKVRECRKCISGVGSLIWWYRLFIVCGGVWYGTCKVVVFKHGDEFFFLWVREYVV